MVRRFIQWKPTPPFLQSFQNHVIHTIKVCIWVISYEILELSIILSEGSFYFHWSGTLLYFIRSQALIIKFFLLAAVFYIFYTINLTIFVLCLESLKIDEVRNSTTFFSQVGSASYI